MLNEVTNRVFLFILCPKLAPKVKEAKSKTENTDPNVPKEPKAAKDGAKKAKKAAGMNNMGKGLTPVM